MMKVLLYSSLINMFKTNQLSISIDEEISLQEFKEIVANELKLLGVYPSSINFNEFLFIVDGKICTYKDKISPTSTVEIFPPFAGG